MKPSISLAEYMKLFLGTQVLGYLGSQNGTILHWAYHMVRTDLDIPANLVRTFEEEKRRVNTTYTASEVTRTYSKLATNLGLLSSLLEDSRKEESKKNIGNIFKKTMEILAPNAPVDNALVIDLTEEYFRLQV